jgi:hypothetical protein
MYADAVTKDHSDIAAACCHDLSPATGWKCVLLQGSSCTRRHLPAPRLHSQHAQCCRWATQGQTSRPRHAPVESCRWLHLRILLWHPARYCGEMLLVAGYLHLCSAGECKPGLAHLPRHLPACVHPMWWKGFSMLWPCAHERLQQLVVACTSLVTPINQLDGDWISYNVPHQVSGQQWRAASSIGWTPCISTGPVFNLSCSNLYFPIAAHTCTPTIAYNTTYALFRSRTSRTDVHDFQHHQVRHGLTCCATNFSTCGSIMHALCIVQDQLMTGSLL